MIGSVGPIRWMSVENVMTREVFTVRATDKVKDAWLAMMEKGITGAPVLDDSKALVGILSESDINRAVVERYRKAKALREATSSAQTPSPDEREEIRELSLAIRAVIESTVAQIVPHDQKVLSVGPLDSLERAIKIMAEHNINRVPVVKEGAVVGLVTRQDVVRLLAGRGLK